MTDLGDDSGVTAGGEHVGHIGIGEQVDLVGRAPWRDMVLRGSDREDR
jgi:hypothetical protein